MARFESSPASSPFREHPCMTKSHDGARASGRRHGAPRNWRETFLATLAETSNVSASAERADISLSWAYKTRREDAEFARRWFVALCEGYDNLEMDLLHRLRTGETKDSEGRKFDNTTSLRLLMAHRESAARERALADNRDEQEVLDSIDAMIDEMRCRAAANARALAETDRENNLGGE